MTKNRAKKEATEYLNQARRQLACSRDYVAAGKRDLAIRCARNAEYDANTAAGYALDAADSELEAEAIALRTEAREHAATL